MADDDLKAGDAAILDALYRDDDGPVDVDDAQRGTLDDWEAMRGVIRHARDHGFDVEPPAAGAPGSMEMLMAAARAHATPARPGLWARLSSWLTPLIAHPAMAGAAALVVVGGAAGVMYMRGQHKVARPPAAEQRSAPAPTVSSPSTDGDLQEALGNHAPADRPGPAARQDGDGAGSAAATVDADRGGRGPVVGERGLTASSGGPDKVVAPGRGAGAKSSPKPEAPLFDPPPPTESLETGAVPAVEGEVRFEAKPPSDADEAPTVTAPTAVPSAGRYAPPPPAPPPPPRPQVRPAEIAADDAPTAPPTAATRRAQAVQITAEAKAAAKSGACTTIAARSKQVAELDPAYHRDVFVRDPDIARCR